MPFEVFDLCHYVTAAGSTRQHPAEAEAEAEAEEAEEEVAEEEEGVTNQQRLMAGGDGDDGGDRR